MRKRSRYSESSLPRKSAFLIILLITVAFLGVVSGIKAEPPASAIWIEPATSNFATATTNVGDEFNVTVWASAASDAYAYQVKITYDQTMLNVTGVTYTATTSSAWFAGHNTLAIPPYIDCTNGYVVVGETLIGGTDVVHASDGSICDITFIIIAAPTPGGSLTSLIDTSQPDGSTYLLDLNGESIPNVALSYATYIFNGGGPQPPPPTHEVVVSSVIPSSRVVDWGATVSVWVVALNNGTIRETFDVNVTYDGTLMGKQTVTALAAGKTQILIFSWNTTAVEVGNYTITATATPVSGQTNLSNIFKTATVQVTPPHSTPPPPPQATLSLINPADASKYLSLTSAQKSVGDTVAVNVTISDVVELGAWQVGIEWNASLLSLVSISQSSDGVFAGQSTTATGPDSSTPGFVLCGLALLPGATKFNGTGTLAQLTLRIMQAVASGERIGCAIGFRRGTVIADTNFGYSTGPGADVQFSYSSPTGPGLPVHDVALADVTPSGTTVAQGFTLSIAVAVSNHGSFTETFNVTVYGNLTIGLASSQTVADLGWGENRTLTFVWNTTEASLGDYFLSATAETVVGEVNTADNNLNEGVIRVIAAGVWTAGGTTISADPSTVQSTSIGQDFTVDIDLSNVVDLLAWQAGITFNPKVLECTGFYEGEFLRRIGEMTIFAKQQTYINNTLGIVYYTGCTLVGPVTGVTGSGQLAYATFRSVGLGVSDFHLTDIILLKSNLQNIPFQTVESFTVPVNGTNYGVKITDNLTGVTNSTTSPLSGVFDTGFDMQNKKISFAALATKDWFCEISVPKQLLRCNNISLWTVKVDGTPVSYNATENDAYTTLYFTHDGGKHTVEIFGTDIIGENPQNPTNPQHLVPSPLLVMIAASLSLMTFLLALVDLRRTRGFKVPSENARRPSS